MKDQDVEIVDEKEDKSEEEQTELTSWEHKPKSLKPYKPPIPFPQRLAKVKFKAEIEKFLEALKRLYINIPFLDAISEMPSCAKFVKDLLSNKWRFQENKMVSLTEECNAILQNKLPPKLKDPRSFSIPCDMGDIAISRAFCDFVASVSLMPYSIYRKH